MPLRSNGLRPPRKPPSRRQPVGNVRVDLADRAGSLPADALEHGHRRLGPERRVAGAEGVEHAAEAEQVAAVIENHQPPGASHPLTSQLLSTTPELIHDYTSRLA